MPRDAGLIDFDTKVGERSGGVAYYCARCGAFMTRAALAIRMEGGHEFQVVNPTGFLFHIRCFKDAPGAVAVGSATRDHTWFPGYDWRVALCSTCNSHVGWMYEGSGSPAVFFGLISPMLVER